ncbi:hypothetical protein DVA86_14065 [Streptomyces armeniacus]|uniref:Uncharacterized protein n=2 Tax=Streptomyces armeniacus TaxID=83291 RepID=A0A345XPP5_9ACTN|nr:hypothetical protein DVA86_14065 [Streptomyces armeniacus]
MAAALTMVGCSNSPDSEPPSSAPASSGSPTAEPSPTETSAFCLDLETYQVGVVAFRADVGRAAGGEPLDIKALRQRAAMISLMGKNMKASAPSDIAGEFRAVRKAIATSSGKLKAGTQVRDVVSPLYGKGINPAFDALNDYECGSAAE